MAAERKKFDWVKATLNLDRRIVYSIVALLVAMPLIFPLKLPVNVTPEVQSFFDAVDALPEGSNIVISGDYGPSSKPELQPMMEALLAHCFAKNLKVHLMALWPDAPSLLQTAIEKQAAVYNKENGKDYVFLGYKAGVFAVILGVNNSIPSTFPTDFYGHATSSMPIYASTQAVKDFDFIAEVAAGDSVDSWITYGQGRTHVPMGLSITAVSAAQYYALYQARQIVGIAAGMKGTAEYEVLLRKNYDQQNAMPAGDATKGMDAQSAAHIFIVLSIILANIAFYTQNKRDRLARRGAG